MKNERRNNARKSHKEAKPVAELQVDVNNEVNANKVDIDYTVFSKSAKEQKELAKAKQEYKHSNKQAYGFKQGREQIVTALSKAKTPKWSDSSKVSLLTK